MTDENLREAHYMKMAETHGVQAVIRFLLEVIAKERQARQTAEGMNQCRSERREG